MSRVAIFTDSASDLDPRSGRRRGDRDRAAPRDLRVRHLQGRRRDVDRGVLGADDRARCAVPEDRRVVAGRLQGGVRGGLRRRRRGDRLDPRRGHPVRRRSRAPRSRATCCPTARSTSSTRRAPRWRRGSSPGWASSSPPRDGRAAEIAEILEARAQDIVIYVALDTLEYLKQGRPDQRHAGGHRDAAVGQADHQGQGRRRSTTVDKVRTRAQGARAADRAHHRAPDRAAGDPAHHQPGRRGVPRRGPGTGAGPRRDRRHDRPGRCLGRAASRPGLRRRGDPVSRLRRSRNLATRLRQRCRPGTIGEARIAGSAAILGPQMNRAPPSEPVPRDPAARPVGSSGRRPRPTAVR